MEYDLFIAPNTRELEEKEYYPSVVHADSVDMETLLIDTVGRGTFRKSEIEFAINQFIDVVASHLKKGSNVTIEGLGRFRVTLGSEGKITSSKTPRSNRIKVKGVQFWPEKDLMDYLNRNQEFKRTQRSTQSARISAEDLKVKLRTIWFKNHRLITRKELETFAHLSTSTAKNRIKELIAMNFLKRTDSSRMVYELVKTSDR